MATGTRSAHWESRDVILRVAATAACGPPHQSLAFNDGSSGAADVGPLPGGPVFAPLREPEYFARAELDRVFAVGALPVWLRMSASTQVSPDVMASFVVQSVCQYAAVAAVGAVAGRRLTSPASPP